MTTTDETRSAAARVALFGFVAATLVVHGVVAWLSPVQDAAWDHLIWSAAPGNDGASVFLESHYTFSDLAAFALAHSAIFHAIVTPLIGLALVWGVFVLAARRLPRVDRWSDVVGIVLVSAMIWIVAPRAGLIWFHRPYVATGLYATTLAVWVLAPYRCGWRPRGAWLGVFLVGALLAGTATRQLGTALAVAALIYIARTPRGERQRWQWLGLAAITAGALLGYTDLPRFDFRGFKPGFELSLKALNMSVHEGGELVTLVLGLAGLKLLVGAVWPKHAGAPLPVELSTRDTLRWLWVWFGLTVFALFGPRYSEALLFPAMIALCVAAFPYVMWLMTSRPLRYLLLAIAAGTHIIIWSFALATYIPVSSEYRDRIARLDAAPEDGIAVLRPYDQVRPAFWAFGEDWYEAPPRQRVATELYRLRDIEMSPAFRRLESNPQIAVRFEIEGASAEQLQIVQPPANWATNLETARIQFNRVVNGLADLGNRQFAARLYVTNIDIPELRGRPLLAAVFENGRLNNVVAAHRPPDDESRQSVVIKPRAFAVEFPEAYAVIGDRVSPLRYINRRYTIQTLTTERHAVVACDAKQCFVVDAFIPVF